MKNLLIFGFIAMLILSFGCTSTSPPANPPPQVQPTPNPSPSPQPTPAPSPPPQAQNQTNPSQPNPTTPPPNQVTLHITAKQFAYDPNVITVNKGDHVHLVLTSLDVTHGFSLPAFNVNTQIVPGQDSIVDFVADQSGTFDFRCSVVCGAGHAGMTGQLVVK